MDVTSSRRPWFDSYNDIPVRIDADAHPSLVALLEPAFRQYADRTAFHAAGQRLTYRELDRLSARFAYFLQREVGVLKGDRVAVMMPNFAAFPIVFLGIARIGAVQVNVNPNYTARELRHQLEDAGVEVIVVANGSTPTLGEVIAETRLRRVVTVAPSDGLPIGLEAAPVDPRLHAPLPLSEILREGWSTAYRPPPLGGTDLLFLQYTGGTTGLSKGACLSHRNLVANVTQYHAFMRDFVRPGAEVVVTALPLYHIFALMMNLISYLAVGAENWLVDNPGNLDGLVDTLQRARPSVFTGVNTLYAGLAGHPRIDTVDFSNLRLAVGGGAAVLATTSTRWQEVTGTFICEGYGLSETSPILTLNPGDVTAFSGTAGLPLPSTDIKLIDDEGDEVAIGEAGEICAKGPQVMSAYWRQPEASAAAFTTDGYFRTGDVGVFDERGFLKIVDRIKDMIIVSGFNVYPNEVEAVAASCPGIVECACVGVPDPKSGEAVRLFAVKRAGADVSEQTLTAHCRRHLAGYKVPRTVRFLAALPKSTVGKILRRELRVLS